MFSFEDMARRGGAFTWEPERGTRLGVMPRSGGNADVRWFDTDPCYVFHPLNAYEEGGTLVLDVARYPRLDFMTPSAARDPGYDDDGAALHRWRIDLRGRRRALGRRSTTCAAEFPRVDERRVGRKHRFGYVAAAGPEGDGAACRCSPPSGATTSSAARARRAPSAPATASASRSSCRAARTSAEDDGYVLALAYDQARNASDFFVLDARNIAGEPIARVRAAAPRAVRLPRQLGAGGVGSATRPSARAGRR